MNPEASSCSKNLLKEVLHSVKSRTKILFSIVLPGLVFLYGCTSMPYDVESKPERSDSRSREKQNITPPETYLPISHFEFRFKQDHPSLPDRNDIENISVTLGWTERGYVRPEQPGTKNVTMKLKEFEKYHAGEEPPRVIDQSSPSRTNRSTSSKNNNVKQVSIGALRTIMQSILQWLHGEGWVGVLVNPHPEDFGNRGDLRPEDQAKFRILIQIMEVAQVNTLVRTEEGSRTNLDRHQWIRELSPLHPANEKEEKKATPLNQETGSDFVTWLNRRPTRNVRTQVRRPAGQGATVNYAIDEKRPWESWQVFAGISNTGTPDTGEWQKQLGFVHNQLTGNDDVLSLNYATSNFDPQFMSYNGSYEFPISRKERMRGRIQAGWSKYIASAFEQLGLNFLGTTWNVGGTLITNIFQYDELFVDLELGASWEFITVEDQLLEVETSEPQLKPSMGLSAEADWTTSSFSANLTFEKNLDGVAETDSNDVLGRSDPEVDWEKLNVSGSYSKFLDPIFKGKEDWRNPETPNSSTFAHELRLQGEMQHALGHRLFSQEKYTVGGMNTVRGYPQSAASGDTGGRLRLEYLYHISRDLPVVEESLRGQGRLFGGLLGIPFKWQPERAFDVPDWDLSVGPFVDYGRTINIERGTFEDYDEVLWSTGIAAEFRFMQNLQVNWSFGEVQQSSRNDGAEEGHTETHLEISLSY